MAIDSLNELKSAFDSWRRTRRNIREHIPATLVIRARQAAREHGASAVVEATKVARRHLSANAGVDGKHRKISARSVPSFSRIDLTAPVAMSRPLAEVETPSGMKLRVFGVSPEALSLLSTLCGAGGTR